MFFLGIKLSSYGQFNPLQSHEKGKTELPGASASFSYRIQDFGISFHRVEKMTLNWHRSRDYTSQLWSFRLSPIRHKKGLTRNTRETGWPFCCHYALQQRRVIFVGGVRGKRGTGTCWRRWRGTGWGGVGGASLMEREKRGNTAKTTSDIPTF